jgi:hypothetical protein
MDYQIYNNTIPKRCKKVMTFGRAEDLKNRESLKGDDLWAAPMGALPSAARPGGKGLSLSGSMAIVLFLCPQRLEALFKCPPN